MHQRDEAGDQSDVAMINTTMKDLITNTSFLNLGILYVFDNRNRVL